MMALASVPAGRLVSISGYPLYGKQYSFLPTLMQ